MLKRFLSFFLLFSSLAFSMQNGGEVRSHFSHCCARWITCATFGENIGNQQVFDHDDSCIRATRYLHAGGLVVTCLASTVLFGCTTIACGCCNPTTPLLMDTVAPGAVLACPCVNYGAGVAAYKYGECLGAQDFVQEVDRRRECAEDVDCNPRVLLSWLRACCSACFGSYYVEENS